MLIDWFTVGAQALNFVILLWLMKRFLYKPILQAIDAREKLIATELADADAKKAEAQKAFDEFQHKNETFDQQRAELFKQATDEAKSERQRLLDEARQAAETLAAKRQETLKDDAQRLNQAFRRQTQQEVFAIARKVLNDLATTSLEERMGEVFTRHLRAMDGQTKTVLTQALNKSALRSAPGSASSATATQGILRSAFDLPEDQRAVIQKALNEAFSGDIQLRFETAPDLISGIEFSINGQKLAWSISDYLRSVEKAVLGDLVAGSEPR